MHRDTLWSFAAVPCLGSHDLQPAGTLACHAGMEIVIWSAVILLMLTGLVGCVVPLLPGTTLILLGALLQKWLLPDTLTWLAVGWIAAIWLLSVLADLGCTLLGTKLFGGGRWGMAGATGGALAGMFFSLPALLFGTMLGAVVAEKWLGKKTAEDALRAGAGAALGFLFSGFAKLACAAGNVVVAGTG
jgi:uncharacterized protein YqgC (DUF456 family)